MYCIVIQEIVCLSHLLVCMRGEERAYDRENEKEKERVIW